MMKKFNMISGAFSHDVGCTVNKRPNFWEWDFNTQDNDISFYLDGDIQRGFNDANNGKKKYLWTLESPQFNSDVFNTIKNNLDKTLSTFEMIFTYNDELLSLNEKFKRVPAMGSWIKEPKIHKKSKLISMIVSNKQWSPQQTFRFKFAQDNKDKIDLFGRGINEIPQKEDGLVDYMFSVCSENDTFDTYFTEKILDCFATGTIPIYLGTKKITNFFDENGILFLEDIDLNDINEELYYSKIDSVKNNFNLVQQYLCPEDFIAKNYISDII